MRRALAFAVLLAGCGGGEPPVSTAPAPVSVSGVPVQRESLVEPVIGTGTVAAEKTTRVGPRVTGIIEAIHVAVGDRVDAGAPLFTTRPLAYGIAVKEAEHALRLARAEADKARRDVRRIEQLREKNVASIERLDEARTAFEIADARRGAAETALERARQDLENTVVSAPYAAVLNAPTDDGPTTCRSVIEPSLWTLKVITTWPFIDIAAYGMIQLRLTCATKRRIHGPNSTPLVSN